MTYIWREMNEPNFKNWPTIRFWETIFLTLDKKYTNYGKKFGAEIWSNFGAKEA